MSQHRSGEHRAAINVLRSGTLVVGLILGPSITPVTAANKTPPVPAPNLPARVIDVLRQQAKGEAVNRRELLVPANGDAELPADHHWAAGHVRFGTNWLTYEEVPARVSQEPLILEYLGLRDQSELTPQRHVELADWCRDHQLADRERAHLANLLDQNPRREDLAKRLGWREVDGQWLSSESAQRLEAARKQYEVQLKKWKSRATAIAGRMTSPQEGLRLAAQRELDAIDDPAAIPAFELALASGPEMGGVALADFLRRIPRVSSTLALARLALFSESDHVRQVACDVLRTRPPEHYVPLILGEMSTPLDSEVAATPPVKAGRWTIYQQQFRRETRDQVVQGSYRLAARIAPSQPLVRAIPRNGDNIAGEVARSFQRQRTLEDLGRYQAEISDDVSRRLSETNAAIAARNQRCEELLILTMGTKAATNPQGWWTWWASYRDRGQPPKGLVEVTETNHVGTIRLADRTITGGTSCLPAGTKIQTELGLRAVETIRPGDLVLSQEIDTGELAYRPVLFTTRRSPQPLTRLIFDHGDFEATRGHEFWVSGFGWRMTKDLKPGQQLHTAKGTATLRDTAAGRFAEVFNLVVDEANTYFVGDDGILSHDVTTAVPTDIQVPGLPVY